MAIALFNILFNLNDSLASQIDYNLYFINDKNKAQKDRVTSLMFPAE